MSPRGRATKPTDEERSEINRANAKARWAQRRADRLAAGLPPTQGEERRRKPRFIDDPEVERFWIAELERLELAPGLDRQVLRAQAKRLADAATKELVASSDAESRPPEGDDEIRVAYYQHEIALERHRAARDAAMAQSHLERAIEAERELGALLIRMGRA